MHLQCSIGAVGFATTRVHAFVFSFDLRRRSSASLFGALLTNKQEHVSTDCLVALPEQDKLTHLLGGTTDSLALSALNVK